MISSLRPLSFMSPVLDCIGRFTRRIRAERLTEKWVPKKKSAERRPAKDTARR
ncbi:hypothetical protein MES5069_250011 [Mesorhizobium escarrei]|uniref:Uncharacterized protein n=1 Tax=Mesorhizobium escarrei TaxID=666018 RepID=A0ABM9DU11_9HYPH|nr:hypothetical protein MES5069_250011 [Mesorhizobium escarrei]